MSANNGKPTFNFDTLAIHGGQAADATTKSRAVPIYQTTSYVFDDADHAARLFALQEFGNIYTRIMNPTTDVFEKRIAALEGGVAGLALASGQAAETLTITHARLGGRRNRLHHLALRRNLQSVSLHPAQARHQGEVCRRRRLRRAARVPSTRRPRRSIPRRWAIPSSTSLISKQLAKIAHENGMPLVIDNTTATPALCRPIEWGADIVINSATKFIGGHGNSIGGVIVDGGKFDWDASGRFHGFRRARSVVPRRVVYEGLRQPLPSSSRRGCRGCATPARASRRSTPSCCCRARRRCTCAWSGIRKMR